MLGRSGSWVGNAGGGIGLTLGRVWLYQDFAAGSGPGLTITGNSNGSGITFNAANIVNSSAVVTKTNGNPIYNNASEIPANLVSVSVHAAAAVTLDGTPAVGQGSVRIWYLYSFQASDTPTAMEIAPQFVTEVRTIYLDAQYLNAGLNLSDLLDAATARLNLGFTAQTAGQVLIADGSTTFTSEAELFWDTSNNRLGIGTNAPSTDLHVYKATAAPVATVESRFTGGVPEVKFSAARTTNADLATNDVAARLNFFARYNSTNAAIAKIDVIYTGSGTTQLGDMVFYTANAGSPAECLRIAASQRVTVATTLAANTSVITPIVYGSESASGSLTLRSTTDATVGNVYISDRSSEKLVVGPIGSVTVFNNPISFLFPTTVSATNGLSIQRNNANSATTVNGTGAESITISPYDHQGVQGIYYRLGGNDVGRIYTNRASDGTSFGYMSLGFIWGIQCGFTSQVGFKFSGVTGHTGDLVGYYNQTDFNNQVASVGADGHFRAPAGSVTVPGVSCYIDTNTGMYFSAADELSWTLGGTLKATLGSTGLLLKDALILEDPGAGTNTVTINTGVVSASYTMTLPLLQGAAGTTLVNNGSGVLSWTNPNTGKAGTVALSISTTTKAITFATARANANYTVVWTFKNTTDSTPAQRAVNVIAQSTTGFTVEWNDALDTANYVGLWAVLEHYDP